MPGARFGFGRRRDDQRLRIDLQSLVARRAQVIDIFLHHRFAWTADERAFGMFGRKRRAARRRAGLVQYWRALRRGLAQVKAWHFVVATLVVDRMDLGRIGVDAALLVVDYRI